MAENSAGNSKWDREVPTIKEFIRAGKTVAEMAEYYDQSKEYMRVIIKRLRRRGMLPSREALLAGVPDVPKRIHTQKMEISFPDKKEPNFNWRDFLQSAIDLQRQKQEKDASQLEATVKIYTDKPFAVSFSSDWHIGSDYTDYNALLSHFDLWLQVPNLFVGLLGDHMDNFVKAKYKSGMFASLFGPQDQTDVLRAMFEGLGKKILFKSGGNHEYFSFDEAGLDVAYDFYRAAGGAPYLREGGGITLVVNDLITYRVYAKHKYRYHSSLNVTNAVKRMHDLESPFDVGVIGHYHSPSIEHTYRWSGAMSKDIILIVTGSYKLDDKWARKEGFGARGVVGCPTVVFFPYEKKVLPFRFIEDAVLFLESTNKNWGGKRINSEFIN